MKWTVPRARLILGLALALEVLFGAAEALAGRTSLDLLIYVCPLLGLWALRGRNPFRLSLFLGTNALMAGLMALHGLDLVIHAKAVAFLMQQRLSKRLEASTLVKAGAFPLSGDTAPPTVFQLRVQGAIILSACVCAFAPAELAAYVLQKLYVSDIQHQIDEAYQQGTSNSEEAFPIYSGVGVALER